MLTAAVCVFNLPDLSVWGGYQYAVLSKAGVLVAGSQDFCRSMCQQLSLGDLISLHSGQEQRAVLSTLQALSSGPAWLGLVDTSKSPGRCVCVLPACLPACVVTRRPHLTSHMAVLLPAMSHPGWPLVILASHESPWLAISHPSQP